METVKALVVEDESVYRKVLYNALKEKGLDVQAAEIGEEALELINKTEYPVIVTDIKLTGKIEGMELLRIAKEKYDSSVLMITAYGDIEMAVEAMRLGAYNFITKPFEIEEICQNVGRMIVQQRTIAENLLPVNYEEICSKSGIIGKSKKMRNVLNIATKASRSDATVLITGESGTGKELIAKTIYMNGSRAEKKYMAINCATLSEGLLESILFGHIKGAFTGAIKDKAGLFEKLDGGTLFMDEVGDISQSIQAKILRVLQEGEFIPLGSTETKKTDVRIIAATNHDLFQLVKNNEFRDDLYYRLNVINITIPPLRERKTDIPLLTRYFIKKYNKKSKKQITDMAPEVEEILMNYKWPGNVRELENVIERAVVMCSGKKISQKHLPESVVPHKGEPPVDQYFCWHTMERGRKGTDHQDTSVNKWQ